MLKADFPDDFVICSTKPRPSKQSKWLWLIIAPRKSVWFHSSCSYVNSIIEDVLLSPSVAFLKFTTFYHTSIIERHHLALHLAQTQCLKMTQKSLHKTFFWRFSTTLRIYKQDWKCFSESKTAIQNELQFYIQKLGTFQSQVFCTLLSIKVQIISAMITVLSNDNMLSNGIMSATLRPKSATWLYE